MFSTLSNEVIARGVQKQLGNLGLWWSLEEPEETDLVLVVLVVQVVDDRGDPSNRAVAAVCNKYLATRMPVKGVNSRIEKSPLHAAKGNHRRRIVGVESFADAVKVSSLACAANRLNAQMVRLVHAIPRRLRHGQTVGPQRCCLRATESSWPRRPEHRPTVACVQSYAEHSASCG